MTPTLRSLFTFALLAIVAAPGLALAGSGGGPEGGVIFSDMVGTHIYSPGPMAPATPFRLEMQMLAPAMMAIHADMIHHPSIAGTQKIACTMQAAPHHRGMVILTCTPGS